MQELAVAHYKISTIDANKILAWLNSEMVDYSYETKPWNQYNPNHIGDCGDCPVNPTVVLKITISYLYYTDLYNYVKEMRND